MGENLSACCLLQRDQEC